MWQKLVIGVVAFKVMFSLVNSQNTINEDDVPSLPFCRNKNGSAGTVLVSTLDGKLSALNSSGYLNWQIETGPDPLLVSNIHKLELTNNGEWIRIIPSLTGTLYKFDGSTIDPISISADKLLKSSFKYSDDLVIAGGIEVRTYGVGLHSGQLLYECNQRKCSNHEKNEMDDILVVERTVQTIRAVEPRTGHERWNFSVGLHNVKLPQVSCIDTNLFDSNISAIIPEGLLTVTSKHQQQQQQQHYWQYKFHSPIVRVWKWDGLKLNEINLFEPKNMPGFLTSTSILPSIYIGMYQKQLYIHESLDMQTLLNGHHQHTDLIPAESHSIAKIPWKPIAASSQSTEDDSTALSVLNNSEYVNGNGYYLYTEQDIDHHNNAHCKKQSNNNNRTRKVIESILNDDEIIHSGFISYFTYYANYYKEIFLMMITAILSPVLIRLWNKKKIVNDNNNKEIIIIEKPVEAEIIRPPPDEEEEEQQSLLIVSNKEEKFTTEKFTSRFMNEYKLIQCLGKGGFGVVFQVKQIIDDCDYAIKRIPLPNEKKSRDRVMREVKALAKLDHKNIIRYFYSWVEHPPLGWQKEHDKNWVDPSDSELDLTSYSITSNTNKSLMIKRQKSYSVSIDIPLSSSEQREPSFDTDLIDDNNFSDDSEDSLIVFENDAKEDSCVVFLDDDDDDDTNNSKINTQQKVSSTTTHSERKMIWKRPQRKHHSLDLTSNNNNLTIHRKPPPMYLYIQMQLCKKESLKEWLQVHKTRDYKEMLNIFVQILDAVEYVHLRKLIHRDLKPGNIFFSLDGQIKVADFGLVKDIESSIDFDQSKRNFINNNKIVPHSRGRHTKEVGTTLYMSPEQSNGRNYDYKVDIYSLGIILFELLVPFATAMERIKILTDIKEKKFPIDFETNYPSEFNLLQNMLDKDPNKRLTTFGIRARPPFNNNNNKNSINPKFEDQHFRLE